MNPELRKKLLFINMRREDNLYNVSYDYRL